MLVTKRYLIFKPVLLFTCSIIQAHKNYNLLSLGRFAGTKNGAMHLSQCLHAYIYIYMETLWKLQKRWFCQLFRIDRKHWFICCTPSNDPIHLHSGSRSSIVRWPPRPTVKLRIMHVWSTNTHTNSYSQEILTPLIAHIIQKNYAKI